MTDRSTKDGTEGRRKAPLPVPDTKTKRARPSRRFSMVDRLRGLGRQER